MILFFIKTIWPFFLKREKMTSLGRVPGFLWLPHVPGVLLLKRILSRGVHFTNSYLFRKSFSYKVGLQIKKSETYLFLCSTIGQKTAQTYSHEPADYGLHSMRSGGGASLAATLGLPDRLIMRQGGWKSAN